MKIKVVSNYDSDENMYNTVLNCFQNKTDLQIVQSDDYEYLAVINGYRGRIHTSRDKVIGILQEPIGNINYDRNLHFYCSKIICQSKDMFKGYAGIREGFLPMFYRHHEKVHRDYFLNYTDVGQRKKLCIIVSSIASPNNPSWTDHNYMKRHTLVRKLLDSSLDFDFYGNGWHGLSDPRYKGAAPNKHETLRKYEYSIAIENVCEKNYVSEKLFDCILNNTVPLYYGCPNYTEVFEEESVIPIDIESSSVINTIEKIISNNSTEKLSSLLKSKKNYFDKMNIFDLMEKSL